MTVVLSCALPISGIEDRQRDDLVVVLREPHAAHAGRVAALESADLVAGQADRLALPRREQDIVILVQQRDADQPVVLVLALELHRDLAVRRHVGEGVHAVAEHAALRGRAHEVKLATYGPVLGQGEDGRDRIALRPRQRVNTGRTSGRERVYPSVTLTVV